MEFQKEKMPIAQFQFSGPQYLTAFFMKVLLPEALRECGTAIPGQELISDEELTEIFREHIPQLPHSLKSKEPMTLQALTIIDLSTHFMEIVALKNKESITIARSLDQVWLCRYPQPVDCLHDNGTEFFSAKFQELLESYGI
jgi:hypothetical protein